MQQRRFPHERGNVTGSDSRVGRIGAVVAGVMSALTASPRRRLEGGRLTGIRMRKRTAAILAALLATFSLTIAAAPSASATIYTYGPYLFEAATTNECMEDPGWNAGWVQVDLWSCNYSSQTNERWYVDGPYAANYGNQAGKSATSTRACA